VARLVFITGGTGYLGRHVIPALIAPTRSRRAIRFCNWSARRIRRHPRRASSSTPTCARRWRLGLVTLSQIVRALVEAIEHPPDAARIMEVPEMKRLG
jgi:hypothetical protein